MPQPNDPRAYALYAAWLKEAQRLEVPPDVVMLTAVGTVAEMIRANRPVSQWDDSVETVAAHLTLILKGPDPDVVDPHPRRDHPRTHPRPVRRRRRVPPVDPDGAP